MVRKTQLVRPPPLLAQSPLERRKLRLRPLPRLSQHRAQLTRAAEGAQPLLTPVARQNLAKHRSVQDRLEHVVRRRLGVEKRSDAPPARPVTREQQIPIVLPDDPLSRQPKLPFPASTRQDTNAPGRHAPPPPTPTDRPPPRARPRPRAARARATVPPSPYKTRQKGPSRPPARAPRASPHRRAPRGRARAQGRTRAGA